MTEVGRELHGETYIYNLPPAVMQGVGRRRYRKEKTGKHHLTDVDEGHLSAWD